MGIEELNGSVVAALISREEYLAARQRIFPSGGSLDWYLRGNRDALIKCGALTLIRGRWLINAQAFDAHVLQAGAAAAAKKVAA